MRLFLSPFIYSLDCLEYYTIILFDLLLYLYSYIHVKVNLFSYIQFEYIIVIRIARGIITVAYYDSVLFVLIVLIVWTIRLLNTLLSRVMRLYVGNSMTQYLLNHAIKYHDVITFPAFHH